MKNEIVKYRMIHKIAVRGEEYVYIVSDLCYYQRIGRLTWDEMFMMLRFAVMCYGK